MQRIFLTIFVFSIINSVNAQYVNDNVLFKTVYAQDLCRELKKNPGYLLLDVRSPGEYNDTSVNVSTNVGRLSNAVNIDVRKLGQRLKEIAAYRSQPVFVYCASSQRSRRASKMLADSGFTNINNINAGITGFYLLNEEQRACLQSMLITNNPYTVLSPQDICKKLEKRENVFLLDVRPDSAWEHQLSNARFNAYGYFRGTKHIALANLVSKLDELPKNKEIIITDLTGSESAAAAKLLKQKGFDKIYTLLEGMDRWLNSDHSKWPCDRELYVPVVSYSIIGSEEFARLKKSAKEPVLLDVRSDEEFENRHALSFRNIGHLDGAVHLPAFQLKNRIAELEQFKSRSIVVYTFSGAPEAYTVANLLTQNGFKDVRVLAAGLFNLRWTAANIPGMSFMNRWVVDVPKENL